MTEGQAQRRIVLATRNRDKAAEIQAMLGDLVVIEPAGRSLDIEIPECGRSLLQNSLAKAMFAFRLCGLPALADDSGLFVEALGGEPGIYSARYGKDDDERIARLLRNLGGVKDRGAAFRVVFVYYHDQNRYEAFEGECRGRIALAPQGRHGFGYDPVFIPRGYRRTFAQLGPEVKNRISHRARALAKFREYILEKKRES